MKQLIRDWLRHHLTPRQDESLRKAYCRLLSQVHSRNLNKLAVLNGTDKWNGHWYTQHYDHYFRPLRRKKLNVLEIGVGGYADPNKGGESLRMWKYYFPKSRIFGVDIYDKTLLQEKRIRTFQGSQADAIFLKKVCDDVGDVHIIIDDGSHVNQHVITAFTVLFPLLSAGGIYVVEDVQTSYWPEEYGGDGDNVNNPTTSMNFFKGLTDCLNYEEFRRPGYSPSYFDKNIASVHFYHNMIFIQKVHGNVVTR